jgi:hypothetical protein
MRLKQLSLSHVAVDSNNVHFHLTVELELCGLHLRKCHA